jgi:hypothetical protein
MGTKCLRSTGNSHIMGCSGPVIRLRRRFSAWFVLIGVITEGRGFSPALSVARKRAFQGLKPQTLELGGGAKQAAEKRIGPVILRSQLATKNLALS